jgi:hypothetical protein
MVRPGAHGVSAFPNLSQGRHLCRADLFLSLLLRLRARAHRRFDQLQQRFARL